MNAEAKNAVRVGLAGAGWFGRIHAATWRSIPGVELVAACDVDMHSFEPRELLQSSFHRDAGESTRRDPWAGLRTYSSVEAMLANEQIDLLDVVVPDYSHFDVAMKGLQAGVDVLVEKPFVTRPEDAAQLMSASRDLGRRIHVGQILRFDDRYRSVMDQISARGEPVRSISLTRNFQRVASNVYGRTHPFLSACIHDIDIALWAMKEMPVRVAGFESKVNGSVSAVVGILHWADGAIATIQNSWNLSKSCPFGFTFDSVFLAEGTSYFVRNVPVVETWSDDAGVSAPEYFFWPFFDGAPKGAIAAQLSHYADCVRDHRESERMDVLQAQASLRVASALIESAGLREIVEVSR